MLIYLSIGYIVSLYFIFYYRLSGKTPPKATDSLMGLIGPFIWPLQIIWYIYLRIKGLDRGGFN
jgi:hypothetical protein